MKIVHIIDNLYAGGAQTFVVQLAAEQGKLGHDVVLIVIDKLINSAFEEALIANLTKHNIELLCLNRRSGKNISTLTCITGIIKFIKTNNPDVVNTHLRFSHLLAGIAMMYLSAYKKKHVITVHNAPEVWSKANVLINGKTTAIYCSQSSLDSSLKRDCKKIVIENGITMPVIGNNFPELAKSMARHQGRKIVLCVGKLSTQKNYELVIQIAKEYSDLPVSFVIAGSPANTAKTDLENFKQVPGIHYIGVLQPTEIHYLMSICDCFLNTSLYEGLPITVLEAFFIGAPSLLSPIPPHYEIGDGMPFCYIPASFSGGLFAEKLNDILSSSTDKEEVKNERAGFLTRFQISNTAKRYVNFYTASTV